MRENAVGKKVKRCIVGLGICKSVEECKEKCDFLKPAISHPEGYCYKEQDLPSECLCATDC